MSSPSEGAAGQQHARDLHLWREADRHFDELVELDAEARQAALSELSVGVRQRVEQLLAGVQDDGFLRGDALALLDGLRPPSVGVVAPEHGEVADSPADSPLIGRIFGPFRLLEEIGRGGMSVVYRAERVDADYEHQVALKLLAAGELATSGRARLAREAQFLAELSHPGIATLLDAGVAEDGTPWLAMELVQGVRIDRYCEEQRLDAKEIVALVLQVVDAVAFAHSRLIVHRDIKPGNVLVDASGHARLLDFGIGKILAASEADGDRPRGGERTSTRVLTPEYGAPEQITGEAVTTATDVHGLGSLLYRLLSGQAPYRRDDPQRLERITPLSRVETRVQGVQADLELIVQMALREEPSRRYASAAELGRDLRSWLELRPVQAMPDSWRYRTRKLLVRRRGASLATAAVVLALLAGGVGTVWQARRAAAEAQRTAEEARRANEVSRLLVSLFESAAPDASGGRELTVAEALEIGSRRIDAELGTLPQLRAELLATITAIYRGLGLFDEAQATLSRIGDTVALGPTQRWQARLERTRLAVAQGQVAQVDEFIEELAPAVDDESLPITLRSDIATIVGDQLRRAARFDESRRMLQRALRLAALRDDAVVAQADVRMRLAALEYDRNDHPAAEALYEQILRALRAEFGGDHTMLANALFARGIQLSELRRDEEAAATLQQAIAMRRRLLGDRHPDIGIALVDLSTVYGTSGRLDLAEETQAEALEILTETLGSRHPEVLELKNSIAVHLYRRGEAEQAADLMRTTVEEMTEVLGPLNPIRLEVAVNLGAILRSLGEHQEALEILEDALEGLVATFGEEHSATSHALSHIGSLHRAQGQLDEALLYYERAHSSGRAAHGENHPEAFAGLANLAGVQFDLERFDEAARLYGQAHRGLEEVAGADDPLVAVVAARWARTLVEQGEPERALELAAAAAKRSLALYGEEHPRTWEAQLAQGEALAGLQRLDEARQLLDSLVERVEAQRPDWNLLAAAERALEPQRRRR